MGFASAIKAGSAYVEMALNDSKLMKGLAAARARLQAFGRGATLIGGAITGAGTATLGILGKFAQSFAAAGDQLDKMRARTGFAAESLSSLGFAAEQGGASIDQLDKSLAAMARFSLEAERGLATATEVLQMLGVSLEQFQGAKPEERFLLIAQAISEVEDPTLRAGLALKVFGRSGRELLPMLEGGRASIEALQDEARRLGIVLTDDDATAAAKLTDAMNRLKRQLGAIIVQIGSALAPALTEIQDRIAPAIKSVIDWVKENRALVVSIAKTAAMVTAGGVAILGLGAVAFSLSAIFGLLASAISLMVSPLGLAAAAAGGLAVALKKFGGLDAIIDSFGELGGRAQQVIDGIKNAFLSGDVTKAAKIFWLGLKREFLIGSRFLRQPGAFFEEASSSWVAGLLQFGNNIGAGAARAFGADPAEVARAHRQAEDAIGDRLAQVIEDTKDDPALDALNQELETLLQSLQETPAGGGEGEGGRGGAGAAGGGAAAAAKASQAAPANVGAVLGSDSGTRALFSAFRLRGVTKEEKHLLEIRDTNAEIAKTLDDIKGELEDTDLLKNERV